MRRLARALAAVTLAAGCAPVLLEKGPVAAIETSRHAHKPVLACSIRWSASSGLAFRVTGSTDVVLLRTARFHTIEWAGDWVPWAEPLELLASPVLLPVTVAAASAGALPPETGDVKVPWTTRLLLATAPLNPATSLLGARLERRSTSGSDVFADPPAELRYSLRQPVPGLAVRYRILGPSGEELASGWAWTDEAGEVRLPEISARPAAAVVEWPGGTARVTP